MLLSFPPHIHFVGQFWSQLNFVVQSSNIHTKCLIQDYRFWKAQNCVLMQKKWSGRLVRFLHFLFWLKTSFLRLQLAYKESSIFLLHHTIFSHLLNLWSIIIIDNLFWILSMPDDDPSAQSEKREPVKRNAISDRRSFMRFQMDRWDRFTFEAEEVKLSSRLAHKNNKQNSGNVDEE